MRPTFLPFAPPSIGQAEIDEVVAALKSGWITTGPRSERFEREFARTVGAPAALALNSGTAVLHLALEALDVGPGDVVIGTPLTFCSALHVVEHVGASSLLVDVEPDTLNIDPDRAQQAILKHRASQTSKIRAIIGADLYGHPFDIGRIGGIAANEGLAVIEDAAHSLGGSWKGMPVGTPFPDASLKHLVAFSFYATKNLTTGEGGMLTGPQDLLDRARLLSLHGMSRDAYSRYSAEGSWYYEVVAAGFKYNMSDIQAAIGIQQLKRLPELQARRREIARRYTAALASVPQIQAPTVRDDVDHAWHLYVIRLNLEMLRLNRAQFIEELKARQIGASVHFIPLHIQPFYRERYGYAPADFPVALNEYKRLVSIPLYPTMNDKDVDDVIDAIISISTQHRR
jgi:dTDP-4-amino-4,6-dideoxygalactose transaminase